MKTSGLLLVLLFLASCGLGRMATGVMIWAPTPSALENGTIVWVWEQSHIRKTFKVQAEKGSDSVEVDDWRILSFNDEGQARAFAAAFAPFKDTWAASQRLGLPVRQEADPASNRIYKLGDGEEVKVLNRKKEQVKEGNLEGHWMQILTKDGHVGWCFDYYFKIIDKKPGAGETSSGAGAGDENLEALLRDNWYPEEFRPMAEQNRINLDLFKPEAVLKSVPENKSFQLTWPGALSLDKRPAGMAPDQGVRSDEHYELPYQTIRKTGDSAYTFEGPVNLRIQYMDSEKKRITVRFTQNNEEKTFVFVKLEDGINAYISKEMAARQDRLQEFLARGGTLVSPTYGTITLGSEGKFQWTGFEALKPPKTNILPADTASTGILAFDWFKDMRLGGETKVVRFQFDAGTGPGFSRVFLWRYLKEGIQLIPIRETDEDGVRHTVLRESRMGVALFFTFQK